MSGGEVVLPLLQDSFVNEFSGTYVIFKKK
jgi:hypothetical protein